MSLEMESPGFKYCFFFFEFSTCQQNETRKIVLCPHLVAVVYIIRHNKNPYWKYLFSLI